MDFSYNEEQSMLRESLHGWLSKHYDFDDWKKNVGQTERPRNVHWKSFADMGWLALTIPEEHGGLGFSAHEQVLVGEAFGAHLVAEPYLSSAVLCSRLIEAAATEDQKSRWLPKIAAGDLTFAFAADEPAMRFNLESVETTAELLDGVFVLNGQKSFVLNAPSADLLLVVAKQDKKAGKGDLAIFVVDPSKAGCTVKPFRTVDDREAAVVTFENAQAEEMLGEADAATDGIDLAIDAGVVYLCAEGLGAMSRLIDQTCEYVKVRKQFGQPIGNFQSLQHRIVEMRVQLEQARALTLLAASKLDGPYVQRARTTSAAKVAAGKAARFVGRNAIQLHGGIGMTDELPIGHLFKRLLMVETLLGDIEFHQKRFTGLPSELA